MKLDDALSLLARAPTAPLDLAELALALAREEYPDLDAEAYLAELAGMAREARAYLRGPLESRVAGLSRYLFHEMGFRGNDQEYYDPRNSYFNQVLDRRCGIPITLSAVAMAVGARAGLNVVGVGLPGHFVAKAVEGGRSVLFDPFHAGRPLTPGDCEELVRQVTGQAFEASPEALRPLPLRSLLYRMLNNLKGAYLLQGDFPRAARVIGRLRQLQPDDPVQRRDLGATLFQAGKPGRAIEHLAAYLAEVPDAADAEAVKVLVAKARAEVARWN
jgi:regulator of sirC expression with transglutaminase-like and TPR domain